MNRFFKAIKVIAFIILKITAFYFGFFIGSVICGVIIGIEEPAGVISAVIFAVIFSCIPTMIAVKIKGYSIWWAAADIAAGLLFFCCIG